MDRNELPPAKLTHLDARYKPFPSFAAWVGDSQFSFSRWDALAEQFKNLKNTIDPEQWRGAVQFAIRMASVDTGALEGLYQVDRGITRSIALQTATWQAEADEKHPDIRRFFAAQLQAYELIIDAVTHATPLSEAWLRRLHEELCAAQDTYLVQTPAGPQEHPLPKGEYKKYPNHVKTRDGYFVYAPVLDTPKEMQRFVDELRKPVFQSAHPILQASYAHYAFILIHPFADGNGRVARALASLFLYRAANTPLMIFADQRDAYLDVLEQTDKGHSAALIHFVEQRGIDLLEIVIEQAKFAGGATPAKASLRKLETLLTAPAGLSHHELDEKVYSFMEMFLLEARRQLERLQLPPGVTCGADLRAEDYPPISDEYRIPLKNNGRILAITLNSPPPASVQATMNLSVHLPNRDSGSDSLIITEQTSVPAKRQQFSLKLSELNAENARVLNSKIAIWVHHIIDILLAELARQVEQSLARSGD
jgi:Fic family protein